VVGVRQLPSRKFPNLTAARVLRILEVLAFHPATAPRLAATIGIHARTGRRLLHTLADEGYVETKHDRSPHGNVFSVSPRLLALAGQLAARLPLVTCGEQTVTSLHQQTGHDGVDPV
jgi:DNA-binding IclR family transcriptional regulator